MASSDAVKDTAAVEPMSFSSLSTEKKLRFATTISSEETTGLKRRSTAAPREMASANTPDLMESEKVLRRAVTSTLNPLNGAAPVSNPARQIRVVTKTSELTVKPRRRNLKAISGMRTLATLWIVLGHFQQTAEYYHSQTFVLVLNRGYIPVAMYIILSGFVTHYAYRKKVYSKWVDIFAFYTRRLCRVLFTYFVSILLGLLDPLFTNHDALITKYPEEGLATIFLIQSWFELPQNDNWSRDLPTQPNPAGWTISTLLVGWLLYPFMNGWMRKFNSWTGDKVRYKLLLCFFLYMAAMIPWFVIFYGVNNMTMSNGQFELLYKFPPLRLADFTLGVVLSELVDHPNCNSWTRLWRFLPDITFIVFTAVVIFANPNKVIPMSRLDAESFFISGLCPLLGILLLGYSINSDKKLKWSISAILEHPVLLEFGNWSFAVYCFQFTLFYMFEKWQHVQTKTNFIVDGFEPRLVAPWLLPYLLTLYFVSALWTEIFEKPFANFVKVWTAKTFKSSQPKEPRKLVAPSLTSKSSSGSVPKQENLPQLVTQYSSDPLQSDAILPSLSATLSPQSQGSAGSKTKMLSRGRSAYVLTRAGSSRLGPQFILQPSFPDRIDEESDSAVNTPKSADQNGAYSSFQSAEDPMQFSFDMSNATSLDEIDGDYKMEMPEPAVNPVNTEQQGEVQTSAIAVSRASSLSSEAIVEEGDGDENDDTVEIEFEIEESSDQGNSDRYASDPEYEKGTTNYDYIPDTDDEDEGDIEVDNSAFEFMNTIIDSALIQENMSEIATPPNSASTNASNNTVVELHQQQKQSEQEQQHEQV